MDDSERSYGYSDDIYHGKVKPADERSYEYGPETGPEAEASDLSPEETALHIEGERRAEDWTPPAEGEGYDSGREGTYASVDSFTWDLEPGKEAEASQTEEREEAVPTKR